jgi:hypothetical protein
MRIARTAGSSRAGGPAGGNYLGQGPHDPCWPATSGLGDYRPDAVASAVRPGRFTNFSSARSHDRSSGRAPKADSYPKLDLRRDGDRPVPSVACELRSPFPGRLAIFATSNARTSGVTSRPAIAYSRSEAIRSSRSTRRAKSLARAISSRGPNSSREIDGRRRSRLSSMISHHLDGSSVRQYLRRRRRIWSLVSDTWRPEFLERNRQILANGQLTLSVENFKWGRTLCDADQISLLSGIYQPRHRAIRCFQCRVSCDFFDADANHPHARA